MFYLLDHIAPIIFFGFTGIVLLFIGWMRCREERKFRMDCTPAQGRILTYRNAKSPFYIIPYVEFKDKGQTVRQYARSISPKKYHPEIGSVVPLHYKKGGRAFGLDTWSIHLDLPSPSLMAAETMGYILSAAGILCLGTAAVYAVTAIFA